MEGNILLPLAAAAVTAAREQVPPFAAAALAAAAVAAAAVAAAAVAAAAVARRSSTRPARGGGRRPLTTSRSASRAGRARRRNASCALALNNDTTSWAHTAAEAEPWLLVDLTRDHYVESVRLWNRAGSEAHLRDFYLAVTNSSDARTWPSSARHDAAVDDLSTRSISGHFDRRVQVHLGQVGRYVLVRRRHTGLLELAELEIFGEELLHSAFGGAAPYAPTTSSSSPTTRSGSSRRSARATTTASAASSSPPPPPPSSPP